MTRALNILLGAVIGFTAHGFASRATEFFVEQGQCRFATGEEGAFYQGDLHTENYMRPACLTVGVADKWRGFDRLGWRVAFVGTGSIQARDNLALPDGVRHLRNGCTPPDEAGCYARFNGSGTTYGVSFGLTYEQPIVQHLSLIGEAGLYFFQHHFKAEARLIDPAWGVGGGRTISYNETSKLWDQPSPMAGITLRYRDIYIAARRYWPSEHRPLSLTNFSFTQYSVGAVLARF